MTLLLLQTVIQELDPVGKQTATVGTADHLLLAVTAKMFSQLGDGVVPPMAAEPPALEVSLRLLRVHFDVPVEVLSHLPVLVPALTARPLALEFAGKVWQDVPLAGVQPAGRHFVELQHVVPVTLDLGVEAVEVDVSDHLVGADGLKTTSLPQTSKGVTERWRVVSDLGLLDVLPHVSHEVLHPALPY